MKRTIGTRGIDGRCHAYVFPCAWEDHCKIGFSRDPLDRISSLHHRWYDVFDIDRIALVEVDSIREARDIELRLRRPLAEHKAPPPSTMRIEAAGVTEWVRGATASLESALQTLEVEGHCVHRGRAWFIHDLEARSDIAVSWALAQFSAHEGTWIGEHGAPSHVRDRLDAYAAFGIDLADRFPPDFLVWYRGGGT